MHRDRLRTWRGTLTPDARARRRAIGARVAARRCAVSGLALLVACGAPPDDDTVATDPAAWTMRPQGLGPIVAGMRVEDVARRVIGDSEARIDSLYEGRVERRPHKYTDGAYLIVRADTAHPPPDVTEPGATPPNSRSDFRLVFETDGARVTQYRAGLFPAVEYVEGCG